MGIRQYFYTDNYKFTVLGHAYYANTVRNHT